MVQPRIGDNDTVGMMVRMSAHLRDRIKAAAEANGRSQNSEIIASLEEAYPSPQGSIREILHRFFNVLALSPESQRSALIEEMKALAGTMLTDLVSRAEFDREMDDAVEIVRSFESALGRQIQEEDIDEVWRRAFSTIGGQRVLEGPPEPAKK